MDAGLAGSCVLVTGAAGGIGSAVVRAFAAEGAAVAIHCNTSLDAAEALAAEVGPPSFVVQADLRDETQTILMIGKCIKQLGRLDAIVVNAGVWPPEHTTLADMSLARWEETLRANLTSAFLVSRAFLKHLGAMPREEASIVLVASTAGLYGEAGHADYAAAKAAMAHGLTLTLKNEIVELAPRGRVNCVCPGWTRTPMAEPAASDPEVQRRVFATMPLEKMGTPDDVANAIVFLSSPLLAGHLTGTIMPIAGGMEGRLLRP